MAFMYRHTDVPNSNGLTHTHTHTHSAISPYVYFQGKKSVAGSQPTLSPDGLVEEQFHSFLNFDTRLEVTG